MIHLVVIEVPVLIDKDGDNEEVLLRVKYHEGNVVSFFLNGEHLFDADWEGNLKEVFEMASNIWRG